MTQDRGPRTEDPGGGPYSVESEDPGQRTQDRGPRTEDPGQRTQLRRPRTEDQALRMFRGSRSKDWTEN